MTGRFICFITFVLFCVVVNGKKGYGPGEQDWGFVDVRKGAHMFYWLYYTTANVTNYTQRPLAIWLQGGPGASSTGYGNFEELGPLNLDGTYRNHTWVKDMNVLFIDNPVGTGFSYVDNATLLTTNNTQIAKDLVALMKGFYKNHPEFQKVPLHIFSESYGGKMAPEFALELNIAIQRGELRSNLSSVALGDPWTSPIDSVLSWAPFLLQMGIIDESGYEKIAAAAKKTEAYVITDNWFAATQQWEKTQLVVTRETKGVDWYNVEKKTRGNIWPMEGIFANTKDLMYRTLVKRQSIARANDLDSLMKGPVTKALNITTNHTWGAQSRDTFNYLREDFMKPVLHVVNKLLDTTNLTVSVFTGQLDLICATPGTVNWIANLKYKNQTNYINTARRGINVNGILEGYTKTISKFNMYWINRAGHMVPADNPAGMSYILKKITNFG